jgi:hypothetical protein
MAIQLVNDSVKTYLAQRGVPSVLGREVDVRERLTGAAAIAWFHRVWDSHFTRWRRRSAGNRKSLD